jgi:predicted SAM-dependent methyltransferase
MKVNFGCGPFYKDGWHNVDLSAQYKVDEILDLRNPLPAHFQNISHAYCGHLLSVIFDDGGKEFLIRLRDRMAVGGVLRICDFDADWLFSKFFHDLSHPAPHGFFAKDWRDRRDWSPAEVAEFKTPLEMFNADCRRWGRSYLLNYSTAAAFCLRAGFHSITRCSEGISEYSDVLSDMEPRRGIVQFCLEALV